MYSRWVSLNSFGSFGWRQSRQNTCRVFGWEWRNKSLEDDQQDFRQCGAKVLGLGEEVMLRENILFKHLRAKVQLCKTNARLLMMQIFQQSDVVSVDCVVRI